MDVTVKERVREKLFLVELDFAQGRRMWVGHSEEDMSFLGFYARDQSGTPFSKPLMDDAPHSNHRFKTSGRKM